MPRPLPNFFSMLVNKLESLYLFGFIFLQICQFPLLPTVSSSLTVTARSRCINSTSLLLPFRSPLSRAFNRPLRSDNLNLHQFFLDTASQHRRRKLDGVPSFDAYQRLLRSRYQLELVETELGIPTRLTFFCNKMEHL